MFGDSLNVDTIGSITYNGVTFDAATETKGITVKPIYDQAGRTVIYSLITITLEGLVQVAAAGGTETLMAANKILLQQPGGALSYTGNGFGALSVNSGGAKDVKWGPKPQLISWVPTGSLYAANVVWTVEIALPNTCSNPLYEKGILAYNYKLTISHDKAGYCRRAYSGYLEIPMTRKAVRDTSLPDHVDQYREFVMIDLPDGFRRESESFTFDESKCRLDFTIIDEQIPPIPLPAGVIDCDVEHNFSSTPNNLARWNNTISGTYEVARGNGMRLAWWHFFQLVLARMEAAKAKAFISNLSGGGRRSKGVVLLTHLGMREKIYGRTASFTAAFTTTTNLNSILSASGLWSPVPGGDWKLWRGSLANSILHPEGRGNDGIILRADSDNIIDLCSQSEPQLDDADAIPGPPWRERLGQMGNAGRGRRGRGGIAIERPPAESSWMYYRCDQAVEEQDQHALLKLLPVNPIVIGSVVGGIGAAIGAGIRLPQAGYRALFPPSKTPEPVQARAAPTYYVTLVGRALRAGYTIPQPVLLSVGGNGVILSNRPGINYFRTGVVANYGIPIVAAKWSLRYLVRGVPAKDLFVPGGPELRDVESSSVGGDF